VEQFVDLSVEPAGRLGQWVDLVAHLRLPSPPRFEGPRGVAARALSVGGLVAYGCVFFGPIVYGWPPLRAATVTFSPWRR
jgi:hypothetical protein